MGGLNYPEWDYRAPVLACHIGRTHLSTAEN
jgi:hypothetical protein